MRKPLLYVLAGVNGAGKSAIGGAVLRAHGQDWFNPDDFARCLVAEQGLPQQEANSLAWSEGMRRLDRALRLKQHYAFETTLGGTTVKDKLKVASQTHDVCIWYCGLNSLHLHLERVRLRVTQGGHDIPAAKIHERWANSRSNLIELMPSLAGLKVFDNSTQVAIGQAIPEPRMLLAWIDAKVYYPVTATELSHTPQWAQAIIEKALELSELPCRNLV